MKQSTLGDFLRTVRKAIFLYVSLASVLLIAFGALFIGLSPGEFTLQKALEWRSSLLVPALALIVGYYVGCGIAIRLHIDSWPMRTAAFLSATLAGAAFGIAALIAGHFLIGVKAEAKTIIAEPSLMASLYVLFCIGGLIISGWSYLTAGWTTWFWDFD